MVVSSLSTALLGKSGEGERRELQWDPSVVSGRPVRPAGLGSGLGQVTRAGHCWPGWTVRQSPGSEGQGRPAVWREVGTRQHLLRMQSWGL